MLENVQKKYLVSLNAMDKPYTPIPPTKLSCVEHRVDLTPEIVGLIAIFVVWINIFITFYDAAQCYVNTLCIVQFYGVSTLCIM